MRLLTFEGPTGAEVGALDQDGRVIPLSRSGEPGLASLQALIEGGAATLDQARAIVAASAERLDPAAIRWLAPLPRPAQMRDFLVFEDHMRMAGWRGAQLRATWGAPPAPPEPMPIPPIWYQQPIYYKCNRYAVAGPGGAVDWPPNSSVIDYELEIACVIGTAGRDIPVEAANAHIFGYTIFNDLTARDLQFREMQGPLGPAKGKDFDGANVLGPVIVTADEIPDLGALTMRARVNGELWSEGTVGTMHWSFAQIIAYVSASETLHPGEVLGSGTVGGGCGLELGRFLKHGDVIELEIDGIGRIATTINAPHVTQGAAL
jgi:2-keto-4-pentenoate hydratase/2-oxohepta-3-ene-1,7-dioic acid hydratase in catechol pathway